MPDVPPNPYRIVGALLIGLVAGSLVFAGWNHTATLRSDLYQPWTGGRLLVRGIDPYPLVGPLRQYSHEFRFLYPLTASAIILPVSFLSLQLATALFAGISAGLLAFNIGPCRWPLFLSFPFVSAAWAGQWSVILSVAFLVPSLSFLYWGKPSVGAALLCAKASRTALLSLALGGAVLMIATIAVVPRWPLEWIDALRQDTGHMTPPILRSGGSVALLAMLAWREADARLILLLACVPQTALWYESVPLFLVTRTFRESLAMTILTSTPMIYEIMFGTTKGVVEMWPKAYQLALFAYLPAVLIVLRRSGIGNRLRNICPMCRVSLH